MLGPMLAARLLTVCVTMLAAGPALAGSITITSAATTAEFNAASRTYVCAAAATSCNVAASGLAAELANGPVTVAATGAGSDIIVTEPVSWTGSVLTLASAHDLNLSASLAHSGTGSGLTLRADAECGGLGGITAGPSSISGDTTAYTHDAFASAGVMASGVMTVWTLLDSTNEIALMAPSGNFALGCDVSGLSGGFAPVPGFSGNFDGLGHAVVDLLVSSGNGMFTELKDGAVISNLLLVRPRIISTSANVGALAGAATRALVSNVAVVAGSVQGGNGTGGLIGAVSASDLNEIYVSGTVTGGDDTGGVVGAIDAVGLLLGETASLSNTMSKAKVTGAAKVGGIAGAIGTRAAVLAGVSITLSWSAGEVKGTSDVGGAVGVGGGASDVYWDRQTSGQNTSAGGATGLTTEASKKAGSYASGFGLPMGSVWMIREDVSRPFLRSMQRLLDVNVGVAGNGSTLATQTATFIATVTLPAGTVSYEPTPTAVSGPIRFLDGAVLIDGTSLVGVGTATVSTASLGVGTHEIKAIYDGTDYHVENSSSVSHTVSKASTTIAIENTAGPINARVTAVAPATGTPSGTVTFSVNDGRALAVTMASGIATLNPSELGAGDFTVSAVYGGDALFNGSGPTAAIPIHVVGPTATALAQSVATTQLGESFDLDAVVTNEDAVPTGTVRFIADNVTLLAEVTLSAGVARASVSTLSGGSHIIVAQYVPADASVFTTSVSPQLTHDVTKANTATNLVVADIHDGFVTLNVEVIRPHDLLPAATGDVTIAIDGVEVGDPALADGTVSFTSDQLPRGAHTISARYEGDGNYNGSASDELEITVELEGFRFVASPPKSITFAGGSVPIALELTPENGAFTEQVTFACENLPPGAYCVFTPVAVNVAPTGTTVGLRIHTQRPTAAAAGFTMPHVPPALLLSMATLAAGLYLLTRRRRVAYVTLALTAFACGGSGGDPPPTEGTPAGTYTVTLKAQGQSITRTTTVEIEVR